MKDFKALDRALQSGDLQAAQDAFATFQKDTQNRPKPPGGENSQAARNFQTLQSALQSGDLQGAQKARDSIKEGFKSARARHHHHHTDGDANSTPTATTATKTISAVTSGGLDAVA
ncbi:MAG TPA: hypothetical protein VHH73_13520 [Verrucomicrobiae bacterium]|nr:hypothetical protein [Verrucomicrobiae bacterium]